MEIVLNKDFTKFKAEKWKGLTQSQLIFGGAMIGVTVGGILFFTLFCHVPVTISSYMISPVTFILGLLGFYEPEGMSFISYLREGKNNTILLYRSILERDEVIYEEKNKFDSIRKIAAIVVKFCQQLLNRVRNWISPIIRKIAEPVKENICSVLLLCKKKNCNEEKVEIMEVENDKKI